MHHWERNSKKRLVKRRLSLFEIESVSKNLSIMEPIANPVDENVVPEKTLLEYFAPISSNAPSCIVFPTTSATHFELKPAII